MRIMATEFHRKILHIFILYRAYAQVWTCAKPLMCKSFEHYAQGYAQGSIYLHDLYNRLT